MNEQEQRIAIVELLPNLFQWDGGKLFWNPKLGRVGEVDPLHDLNAMHEAEKHLHGIQTHYYALRLGELTVPFSLASATAAQRAEAFLRTIGKWTDE